MDKEKLIQAVQSYERIHTISFKRPVQLKQAQMSNALKKIVCDANVSVSDIVALMDTTLANNGKSGYLLTSR